MKIAYFDTIAGVSGDMTLGAFISAGASIDALSSELQKLNLSGVELQAAHVVRNGIVAVKLDVVISATQSHYRHLRDILTLIDGSPIGERVRENAKKIFMEVARAEAKVHNSSIEKVHFHEVGAIDSIVDIVGAAICFDQLGIQEVYSSPVKLGSGGLVDTEHGKLPVPGPATAEILKGYPTVLTDIPYELTTPTGAAIIKAMSRGTLVMEQLKVESIGYGAGTREIAQVPNILRIMIGELLPVYAQDEVVTIETNIDDMNPEIFPFVIEQLLAHGANDAYLVPVIMKKGRPGFLLSALVDRSRIDEVLGVIFSQTSSLGVRIQPVERRKLPRGEKEVRTTLGVVKMKVVIRNGIECLVPEYEECRKLAVEKKIPLIEVYRILERER